MKNVFYLFHLHLVVFVLFACNSNTQLSNENQDDAKGLVDTTHFDNLNVSFSKQKEDESNKLFERKKIDSTLLLNNLIDIQELNRNIWVDLKYGSEDNFMKIRLYERLERAFLQKDVAERLAKCQEYLSKIDTGLHLLVYDAVRPVSVQLKMWQALDTIPVKERGKFVSNPASKSLHNFGAAVDLTICNSKGIPLDMGAGYDDIRQIAYPSLEAKFLASGELSKSQVEKRALLRKVMQSQRFRNIPTEWWHFNACSRSEAFLKYKVLEKEP